MAFHFAPVGWAPQPASTTSMAGTFTKPDTVEPSASLADSKGDITSWAGRCSPYLPRNLIKYCDQLMATVAAPTEYSSTRSQPIIQAKSSPMVA